MRDFAAPSRPISDSRLSRRSVLIGGTGILLAGLTSGSALAAALVPRTRWVLSGLYDYRIKSFGIGLIDLASSERRDIPVFHNGHGLCLHPTKPDHAIIFAQRPGTVSYEFDYVRGEVTKEFHSDEGQHFYGHGLGIAGRGAVFCTENRYGTGEVNGVVTIRDAESYDVLGEFSSHGIGPHDMRLLDGGATIVIANGGFMTRPNGKGGVIKKNRTPEASLSLIDVNSGALKENISFSGLSLKHLDVSRDGNLGLALRGEEDSLCIVRRSDGSLVRAKDPGGLFAAMDHHTLSIRVCDSSDTVGVTAPKGNLVAFWNSRTGDFKSAMPMKGASGLELTHDERHFVVTSRGGAKPRGLTSDARPRKPTTGEVTLLDSATLEPVAHSIVQPFGTAWGSHSLAVAEA